MNMKDSDNSLGAVALETALVIGVVLFLILGAIDLGRIAVLKGMLHNAAELTLRDLKVQQGIGSDSGSVRTAAAVTVLGRGRNHLLSGFFTDETTVGTSYSALTASSTALVDERVGELIFPSYANASTPVTGGRQYVDVTPAGRLLQDLATIPVGANFSATISPYFFPFFGQVVLSESAYGYVEVPQIPSAPISPDCVSSGNCPCPYSVPVPGQPPATWNGSTCLCAGNSVQATGGNNSGTVVCECPDGTTWSDSQSRCLCDNPPVCGDLGLSHQYVGDDCQCHACSPTQALNSTGTGCACGWEMQCDGSQGYVNTLWNCSCYHCPAGQKAGIEGNHCDCDTHVECPTTQYMNPGNGCVCMECPPGKVHTSYSQGAPDDGCVCPPSTICSGNTYLNTSNGGCVCTPCDGVQVPSADRLSCTCPNSLPTCPIPSQIHSGPSCDCGCPNGAVLTDTVDAGTQCVQSNLCPDATQQCFWNGGNPYQPEDP